MYLNGIKHNVVTKLNPLTRNVGLDGQMDRQTDEGHFYNPPFLCGGGYDFKAQTCELEL